MKKSNPVIILLASLFFSNTINAAVYIQTKNSHHATTHIYIEQNKARIELPHHKGYIIIDLNNKTMKAVIHEHKTIIDMSEFLQQNTYKSPAKYVDTYTKTMGLGPTIINYETEEYALYANENYCGSLYVSVDAMRDMGVTKFARALFEIQKNIQKKLHTLTGITSSPAVTPCEESQRKANLKLRQIGFPLKSTDKNKHLQSIVTQVNKNAQLPVNAFSIPEKYSIIDPQ